MTQWYDHPDGFCGAACHEGNCPTDAKTPMRDAKGRFAPRYPA